MGQAPNLDVLLGPVTAPPPPLEPGTVPVFRTELVAPLQEPDASWLLLAAGIAAVVLASR